MFEAERVVSEYARPFSGSTLFVIPGTSQRMAELLIESFTEEVQDLVFGEELQRRLVAHLSYYFELAERPLKEIQNKTLLDNLRTLGLLNRLDITNELRKSSSEEELYDPIPQRVIDARTAAETQRNVKTNPTPAPRKRKRQGR
jgi:myosin-crossreactive antigen